MSPFLKMCSRISGEATVYRYIVVDQKVDNKGVNMLRCTFCNKVWQGTQYYTTKHFTQPHYYKKVSDEALFQIAQKCTHRFEADQVDRVRRYAQEHGLDVPRSGAMGGEAERPAQGVGEGEDTQHSAKGGVARDGEGEGAAEEDEADVELEVGVVEGEGGVTGFDPVTRQRTVDWERRWGKTAVPETACMPGSSKRKDGGADLSATKAGKRLRQQKVTDTYDGEFALQHPGGGPLPVLPSHCEIASMQALEIHRDELAEELEEREDAPDADIPGGSGSLVRFTGLQLTTTTWAVRLCVQGSGPEEVAFAEVPPVIVEDLGSEPLLQTPISGRRSPQDTAGPLDVAELARAAVLDVTRQEDTDPRRPFMPPPPPRSRHQYVHPPAHHPRLTDPGTPVSGRRSPQDTAGPLDVAELARAAVLDVTRQEDTDP
ncbi:hypothetical protein CBR_g20030 [Chara braunii]|uniref:Uncharacterized protein n=1 Tax=Chara braunii TaxID=69332 RepID=A0A388KZB5_CHABU|nr:hypothetical protein CBR_g20030 [Chara braunii]|eukprot:GBG75400.1 hypothetical protein CBR_g20030 [Chara braunii]